MSTTILMSKRDAKQPDIVELIGMQIQKLSVDMLMILQGTRSLIARSLSPSREISSQTINFNCRDFVVTVIWQEMIRFGVVRMSTVWINGIHILDIV